MTSRYKDKVSGRLLWVTEDSYGIKRYYKDENYRIFHREDGPAIDAGPDEQEWHQNGYLHRLDGPAIRFENPSRKRWFVNGIRIDLENLRRQLKNL